MLVPFRLPFALALASLAGPALASELHVPGDYPTLQGAIDAAAAGDVIVVSGFGSYGPLVLDKPLTILGNPQVDILVGCDAPAPNHGLRLEGPASGTVVLANARLLTQDCFQPASGIGGGGFDELHLLNVSYYPWSGLTGLGDSAPSVQVDVPYLLVEGSTLYGGIPDSDHCASFLLGDGYPAIEAPASVVTILGSTITGGGEASFYCCDFCTCAAGLPSGGAGGDAVVANEVFVDAASTVTGGKGSTFYAYDFPGGTPTPCASKPDGVAYVATLVHQLPGDITSSSVIPLGGTWTLNYDVPGPNAWLFLSTDLQPPTLIPGAGFSFLATPTPVGLLPTAGPQALSFGIPPAPALLGLQGAFQILDSTLGLTAPAVGLLGP